MLQVSDSCHLSKNEDCTQNSPEDILAINQYGRRIKPPFSTMIQDYEMRFQNTFG